MYVDYEGYWYISRQSIMEMLGDRIVEILQALQLLKQELSVLLEDPASSEPEQMLASFRNEIILAFQIDGLCQSSLEIRDDVIQMYTVIDGNESLRTGDVVDSAQQRRSLVLKVTDREDQESSDFVCKRDTLEVEDGGVLLTFVREPTFFFSDIELDMLEKIVRDFTT